MDSPSYPVGEISLPAGPAGGDSLTAAGADRPASKKSAWKRPSNGAVAESPPPGASSSAAAVMDADSWPALSESAAKGPGKPVPLADSFKVAIPDGSDAGSITAPVVNHHKQSAAVSGMASNSSTANNLGARQKPTRRTGGGGNGQPSSPVSSPRNVTEKSPSAAEHSPRDNSNSWDHSSRNAGKPLHSHSGSSNQRMHNGTRRGGNNGGGGGYGGRRNQGRGAYDGYYRSPIGRDPHGPHPPAPLGIQPAFIHLPPSPTPPPPPAVAAPPFITAPPQVRPFAAPMFYHDMAPHIPPVYYMAPPPPYVAAPASPPPFLFAQNDPRSQLLNQIDYYFSPDNLCRDTYLRGKMDEQGWVSISVVANFNKVRKITNNIAFVIETLRLSNVVEMQGEKIRKRDDWKAWVLPRQSGLDGASNHSSMGNSLVTLDSSGSGNHNNQGQDTGNHGGANDPSGLH